MKMSKDMEKDFAKALEAAQRTLQSKKTFNITPELKELVLYAVSESVDKLLEDITKVYTFDELLALAPETIDTTRKEYTFLNSAFIYFAELPLNTLMQQQTKRDFLKLQKDYNLSKGLIGAELVRAVQKLLKRSKLETRSYYDAPTLPMVHNKITDGMAVNVNESAIVGYNPIEGTTKYQLTPDLTISTMEKFLKGNVAKLKLAYMALQELTALNHTERKKSRLDTNIVTIPLEAYAFLTGYDITNENDAHNLRRQARESIKLLMRDIMEFYHGKEWEGMAFVSEGSIRKGAITLTINKKLAEILIANPLTQIHRTFFKIDARYPNASAICVKMCLQYYNNSNKNFKTNQTLKTKLLLSWTDLPTPDNAGVKKNGWKSRIKEPLENNLNHLKSIGFLESWKYTKAKGVELTEEEADFTTYTSWINTNIFFTIAGAKDQAESQ